MKIVTLTLNPAFDTHCDVDELILHHENFATITSTDAGGKGVNISRALTENGVENLAVIITGKENETAFLQNLSDEGIDYKNISTFGRIRENITVHQKDGKETRISFEGFSCNKEILDSVFCAVGDVDENTVITLTGSNPVGLSVTDVSELLEKWKKLGAKIVIDSRSFTPNDLAKFGPYLIKPNKDESAAFAQKSVTDIESAAKTALEFHKKGVENVLISLGEEGAVLACLEGVFYATAPKISAISTIGAGDSMIAGFIAAKSQNLDIESVLKNAVAFGSAACLTNGTNPPRKSDIQKIKNQINIKKL